MTNIELNVEKPRSGIAISSNDLVYFEMPILSKMIECTSCGISHDIVEISDGLCSYCRQFYRFDEY